MSAARLLIALTVLLALTVAAPAAADDASVKRAFDSGDAAFKKVGKKLKREQDKHGFRRGRRLLRLNRRYGRIAGTVLDRLKAEEPSSPTGAEAHALAIKSMTALERYWRVAVRHTRAVIAQQRRRTRRLARRLNRIRERGTGYDKRARKLFRELGLE